MNIRSISSSSYHCFRCFSTGQSYRATLRVKFDTLLNQYPYPTKAVSTGVTYIASDLTAQFLEGAVVGNGRDNTTSSTSMADSASRALRFGAVGCFWVGPLLTAWFEIMDRIVPGKSIRPIAIKLVADQVLQGPFMIGTMYFWTAYLNGKNMQEIEQKLEENLWRTWVNSVYVWGPVQVAQQALIPLQYRVLVANIVSYFWDTYLSFMMMSESELPTKGVKDQSPGPAFVRRTTSWRVSDSKGDMVEQTPVEK